jgi:replicative DNA helicase
VRTNVHEIILCAALKHVENKLDIPFSQYHYYDFPERRSGQLWEAIKRVYEENSVVDAFSVRQKLDDTDAPIGGWDRAIEYYSNYNLTNFPYYLNIFYEEVKRYRAWRSLISAAEAVSQGKSVEESWPEIAGDRKSVG